MDKRSKMVEHYLIEMSSILLLWSVSNPLHEFAFRKKRWVYNLVCNLLVIITFLTILIEIQKFYSPQCNYRYYVGKIV